LDNEFEGFGTVVHICVIGVSIDLWRDIQREVGIMKFLGGGRLFESLKSQSLSNLGLALVLSWPQGKS